MLNNSYHYHYLQKAKNEVNRNFNPSNGSSNPIGFRQNDLKNQYIVNNFLMKDITLNNIPTKGKPIQYGPSTTIVNNTHRNIFGNDFNDSTLKKQLRNREITDKITNTNPVTMPRMRYDDYLKAQEEKSRQELQNKTPELPAIRTEEPEIKPDNKEPVRRPVASEFINNSNDTNDSNTLNPVDSINAYNSKHLNGNSQKEKFISSKSTEISTQHGFFNQLACSVREYAYMEEANPNYREYMEDVSVIKDNFTGDNHTGFFSLYDGHGGKETALYIKDRIPDLLLKELKEGKRIDSSLTRVFEQVDSELKSKPTAEHMGSTACVVLVTVENSQPVIYSANTGDSRTIIVNTKTKTSKRLSYDHKASDPAEILRLRQSGGAVFNGRLFGQLAVSRAFGDHAFKRYGVIATPYIVKHPVEVGDKYVVIASDGVWDVLSDEEVSYIASQVGSANELCEAIVGYSLRSGSLDNISVIAILLRYCIIINIKPVKLLWLEY